MRCRVMSNSAHKWPCNCMQTFVKGVEGFSLLSACQTFFTGSQFFLELEPDKPKLGNDVVLCAFHLGLDKEVNEYKLPRTMTIEKVRTWLSNVLRICYGGMLTTHCFIRGP